jgi:S1-C subfamily serine protease
VTEPKRSRGPRRWLLWVAVGAALVVGGVAGGLIVGATQSSSSAANLPVDLAKRVADEIIATGTVSHAFFGLQTVPIPPAAAGQAGADRRHVDEPQTKLGTARKNDISVRESW